MTISSTVSESPLYLGTGIVDTYAYPFLIYAETDLIVVERDLNDVETSLVLGTDYNVTGVGNQSGGNVVLTSNLTVGHKLRIYRKLLLDQGIDLINQASFFLESLERGLDEKTMQIQQLQAEVDRSLKRSVTSDDALFDIDTIVADVNQNTVAAQAAQSAAETAETNAAISETAAYQSEINAETHNTDAIGAKDAAEAAQSAAEAAQSAAEAAAASAQVIAFAEYGLVEAKTADHIITAASLKFFNVFTNEGALEDIDFYLPPGETGMILEFFRVAEYKITVWINLTLSDFIVNVVDSSVFGLEIINTGDAVTLKCVSPNKWVVTPESIFQVALNEAGYWGGGRNASSTYNIISAIRFSDDSFVSIAATIGTARHLLAGLNSSVKGYWGGGIAFNGPTVNNIDAIQFSDDSFVSVAATIGTAKHSLAGLNSSVKGYWGGGFSSSYTNIIDAIQFSDDSFVSVVATIGTARGYLAGANSSVKGYWGGGIITGDARVDDIDAIQFSDDSFVSVAAIIGTARGYLAGVNSSVKGYWGGGYISSYTNIITAIQFSDDSFVSVVATIGTARGYLAGANSSVKGYWGGGFSSSYTNIIDAIQFSDDSFVSIAATIGTVRNNLASCQSGGNL